MGFSLLKGFARRVHPYALSQYMYTFERGFLVRALPGHAAKLVCDEQFECIGRLVDVLSTLAVVGFAIVLFVVVRARLASSSGSLLLAVVGSGPLLVSIGATRGYRDALTLTLGLLAYYCYTLGRRWLALLLFGVALLVHEIVAVYVLPLFVLPALVRQPLGRRLRHVAVVLGLALATHSVVRAGAADRAQRRLLVSKLERSARELSQRWRGYRRFGPLAARSCSCGGLAGASSRCIRR